MARWNKLQLLLAQVPALAVFAACCHARAGATDRAFVQLALVIDDGFDDVPHLRADADLTALHADQRWAAMIAALTEKVAIHRASINAELAQSFADDQADRKMPYEQIDWSKVGPRDKAHEQRVDQILAAGEARVADDYYHAAMVFQHGDGTAAIERARELTLKALQIDPQHRLLVRRGRPQKWGTQFSKKDGLWVLDDVDLATTDAQRAEWEVPPLAEARARGKLMNSSPK